MSLQEFAPAKLNLTLRVLGRRPDGYHALQSLVAFASVGDALRLEPGGAVAITLDGPFAEGLAAEADNLVLRAARGFLESFPGSTAGHFRLTKNLPVASGIGGGSSDAAAALRLLARANRIDVADPMLMELARALGADVPVCLQPALRSMSGIGHELGPPLPARQGMAVLINPGLPVETRAVFARLDLAPGETFRGTGSANDLEAAAVALCPPIAEVLSALREAGAEAAQMSGSGATCFGLFADRPAAEGAARRIAAANDLSRDRHWWIAACSLLLPA